MILHNLCCLNCNNLYNQHWNCAYFVYSCWYLKEDVTRVKFGTRTQTTV